MAKRLKQETAPEFEQGGVDRSGMRIGHRRESTPAWGWAAAATAARDAERMLGPGIAGTGHRRVSLSSVPRIVASAPEIADLTFDQRTKTLLRHIDGEATLETILDSTAMSHDDAMTVLEELLLLGVVRLRVAVDPPR